MIEMIGDLAWAVGLGLLTFGAAGVALGIGQIMVLAIVGTVEEIRMRRSER